MMSKRIFIVHKWDGSSKDDWRPWAKEQLTKIGFEVSVLDMPEPYFPRIETWVPYLASSVGKVDENTSFIGHSIGFQTIVRYLETMPESQKVGHVVSVAGWFLLSPLAIPTSEEREIASPWMDTAIDLEKVKKHPKLITAILSDNDPFVSLKDNLPFYQKLQAKIVMDLGKGHFDDGFDVIELPALLEVFK